MEPLKENQMAHSRILDEKWGLRAQERLLEKNQYSVSEPMEKSAGRPEGCGMQPTQGDKGPLTEF